MQQPLLEKVSILLTNYERAKLELVLFNEIKTDKFCFNNFLNESSRVNDREMIEYCIKQGANDISRAWYTAKENGHNDLVKFFIEKGADTNYTPIFISAINFYRLRRLNNTGLPYM